MASCNILDFGLIQEYYLNNISDSDVANPTTIDLCCYSSLPMTYDTFVTGVETLYNNQCLRDREFSDYITKLYTQCLSGAATSHTHTETYWSANTDGSISNSGLTSTKVSGNTSISNSLYVMGTTGISGNTYVGGVLGVSGTTYFGSTVDVGINGTGYDVTFNSESVDKKMIWDVSRSSLNLFDETRIEMGQADFSIWHDASTNLIRLGPGEPGSWPLVIRTGTSIADTVMVINNEQQVGIGTYSSSTTNRLHVSGTSAENPVRLQTVQSGEGYILVIDDDGVLYKTTSVTSGDTAGYWTGNTDGSISPSGLTTNVGIGTSTPTGLFEVKDLIKFPESGSVYIGDDAGANWEANSISNTAVGRLSMGLGTMSTALYNSAFGFASLAYITTGDHNTAVGLQSNTSIDTGSWNTSIGKTSMFGATYHSYNTAVGSNTLYFTTSGGLGKTVITDTHNTAIGYSSQYYSLNGAYNTSVGSNSIGNSTIAYAGTGNTAMGYKAMFESTTGNYNTAIGYQAGDNITSGDNNICIGNDADIPSATADYQMNIGGIIHGQDAYSDSAISQVGIGTTSPLTKLDVHHNPNELATDTGGGEVVTFGTNGSGMVAGTLYYLHTDGAWTLTRADAVANGGSQLLGIALGTAASNGVLLRGFFNTSKFTGTADEGLPVYVCETTAGNVNIAAPASEEQYIRIVGYCTNNGNVIYFNPDQTWVELG